MKRTLFAVLICVTILTTMLVGCSDAVPPQKAVAPATTSYSQGKEDSKKVYAEVASVSRKVEGFLKAISTGDYRTVKGDEGYQYCSKELLKELASEGDQKDTADYIKYNKVINVWNDTSIKELDFYKNEKGSVCDVKASAYFTITNATDKYLKDNKMKLNTKYVYGFTINMLRENGVWEVDGYSVDSKEKAE